MCTSASSLKNRVLRQHPVEVGTEPVRQIIGLDRPAEPPRMEATGNSVADLDPCHAFADRSDLARTVGKRAPRRASSDRDRHL
jgi:hypothetical protein